MKPAQHILAWWMRCFYLCAIAIALGSVATEAKAGFMPPDFDAVSNAETRQVVVTRTQWAESGDPFVQVPIQEISDGVGSEAGNSNGLNYSVQSIGMNERGREKWLPARRFAGHHRERVQVLLGFLVEVMRPPKEMISVKLPTVNLL